MPSMSHLALRYLAWLIGLRLLYGFLVQQFGLPNSLGTGVILAAAPLADIAMTAVRRAERALVLADLAVIWGLCLSIFVAVQVILPAILIAQMRSVLADPEGVQRTALIIVATGAMMALFLWIGKRTARAPGR